MLFACFVRKSLVRRDRNCFVPLRATHIIRFESHQIFADYALFRVICCRPVIFSGAVRRPRLQKTIAGLATWRWPSKSTRPIRALQFQEQTKLDLLGVAPEEMARDAMLAVARRFHGDGIDVKGATKLDRNMGWGGCDEGTQVKEESSQPQRVGKARQVENGARANLMPHCCANISNRRPPVEDNQIGALDEIPFSNLALELLMMSMTSAKQCQTMSLHVLKCYRKTNVSRPLVCDWRHAPALRKCGNQLWGSGIQNGAATLASRAGVCMRLLLSLGRQSGA